MLPAAEASTLTGTGLEVWKRSEPDGGGSNTRFVSVSWTTLLASRTSTIVREEMTDAGQLPAATQPGSASPPAAAFSSTTIRLSPLQTIGLLVKRTVEPAVTGPAIAIENGRPEGTAATATTSTRHLPVSAVPPLQFGSALLQSVGKSAVPSRFSSGRFW